MNDRLATDYSATADVWPRGPGRIYDRLAEVLVSRSPVPLAGARALDVGAGTGAATRAALAAGASFVVALDGAVGMLAHDAAARPPSAAGDATALPFAPTTFDVAIAAFSLNHLADPVAGLAEMVRVTRRGGGLLISAYAVDDTHPVKQAAEAALRARGWEAPAWYGVVRDNAAPLATADGAVAIARQANLPGEAEVLAVPFPDLGPADLVAWRLGMGQSAPFVAHLSADDQVALVADAVDRLGAAPPLVRSIVVLRSAKP